MNIQCSQSSAQNNSKNRCLPAVKPAISSRSRGIPVVAVIILSILLGGCAIKRMTVNSIGNAIADSGTVYSADDDIEFVGAATPFALKLMESLLSESPQHQGLLLAAARGFTQYAFAYIQLPADDIEQHNVVAAYQQRDRARRMYLRARDYGLRGLETSHPGFTAGMHNNPANILAGTKSADVPLLYWTATAWGAAIALGKDEPALLADIPLVEGLTRRVLTLDPSFEDGAVHVMMISLVMAMPGSIENRIESAEQYLKTAIHLSNAQSAAPYVTYAESVAVAQNDRSKFEKFLGRALAIDQDKVPRRLILANAIYQHRARWLLAHVDDFFTHEENNS